MSDIRSEKRQLQEKITIRLSPETKKKIDDVALAQNATPGGVVRKLIVDAFESNSDILKKPRKSNVKLTATALQLKQAELLNLFAMLRQKPTRLKRVIEAMKKEKSVDDKLIAEIEEISRITSLELERMYAEIFLPAPLQREANNDN